METKNENQKSAGQKIKFGVIAAVLILAGLVAGYAIGIFAYLKVIGPYVAEMKYKKFLEDYLKPYKEDFTGGNTPEETIDLFVAALKKGDYELAVKYFVIQEQEKQRESYMNLNEENKKNINDWITEIESNKKTWKKENIEEGKIEFWYNTGKGENERTSSIYLRKNINNKWKINHF